MELLAAVTVPPFLVAAGLALLLRHHLRAVSVVAAVVAVAYVAFAYHALGSEHEYGALAAIMYGFACASWLAGLGVGAAVTMVRRRLG